MMRFFINLRHECERIFNPLMNLDLLTEAGTELTP